MTAAGMRSSLPNDFAELARHNSVTCGRASDPLQVSRSAFVSSIR